MVEFFLPPLPSLFKNFYYIAMHENSLGDGSPRGCDFQQFFTIASAMLANSATDNRSPLVRGSMPTLCSIAPTRYFPSSGNAADSAFSSVLRR